RVARGHEQTVAAQAPEAEVGAALGQRDFADAFALGVEHHHAVQVFARTPADPEIAVGVAAKAVGDVAAVAGDDGAALAELRSLVDEIVGADHPRHDRIIRKVDLAFVGRKAEPVRPQVVGDHARAAAPGIETIDAAGQFGFFNAALVGVEAGG